MTTSSTVAAPPAAWSNSWTCIALEWVMPFTTTTGTAFTRFLASKSPNPVASRRAFPVASRRALMISIWELPVASSRTCEVSGSGGSGGSGTKSPKPESVTSHGQAVAEEGHESERIDSQE